MRPDIELFERDLRRTFPCPLGGDATRAPALRGNGATPVTAGPNQEIPLPENGVTYVRMAGGRHAS